MLKGAVARRYAEAVFEIATQQGTLDRWLADVKVIGEAFGNRHLAFVLREPKIAAGRKELIVHDLLEPKVQHEALNLALVLVRDGLIEIAPRLAQEFERLYNEQKGQAVAQVTSAMPLDESERAWVASELQRVTGKRILLQERVDPAILGGVMARVGDTLIDGSVRRRLLLLRDQIIKGGGSFGGPSDGRPEPAGGGGMPPGGAPAAGPGASGAPFVVSPPVSGPADAPPATPPNALPDVGPERGGSASNSVPASRASGAFSTSARPASGQASPRSGAPPANPRNRKANGRNKGRRR